MMRCGVLAFRKVELISGAAVEEARCKSKKKGELSYMCVILKGIYRVYLPITVAYPQ